jgi:hypothetical protein
MSIFVGEQAEQDWHAEIDDALGFLQVSEIPSTCLGAC